MEVDFTAAVAGAMGHILARTEASLGCGDCHLPFESEQNYHLFVETVADGNALEQVVITLRCGPCSAVVAVENPIVEIHDPEEAVDAFDALRGEA